MKKLLFGANIVMIFFFILRFSSMPPQIPLFYSKVWGEDQLADNWMIFILPIIMNVLFFLNNFFYKKFFLDNPFAKKIIDYLDLFVILGLSLIFLKIIFLTS